MNIIENYLLEASQKQFSLKDITVTSKNNNPIEIKVSKLLEKIIQKYNLRLYTNKILVEKDGISHSHPIFTISTSYKNKNVYIDFSKDHYFLLDTLVHENFHLDDDLYNKNIKAFKKRFPESIKVNGGTWHIFVIYKTHEFMKQLKIPNKELKRLYDSKYSSYPKITKIVFDNYDEIRKMIK